LRHEEVNSTDFWIADGFETSVFSIPFCKIKKFIITHKYLYDILIFAGNGLFCEPVKVRICAGWCVSSSGRQLKPKCHFQ